MTRNWFLLRLFLLYASLVKTTAVKQLFVGKTDCGTNRPIHNVNENELYEIVWDTGIVPSTNPCAFTFQPARSNDVLDDYRICVDAITYNVHNCDISVNYYIVNPKKGRSHSEITESHSCGEKPPEICGYKGGFFEVEFRSISKSTFPTTNNFKLSVKVVSDSSSTPYIIAVGIIVGILFIVTVLGIIFVFKRKYNARDDRLITNSTYFDDGITTDSLSNRQTSLTSAYPLQTTNHVEQFYGNNQQIGNSQSTDNNQSIENNHSLDNNENMNNLQIINNNQSMDNSQIVHPLQ